MLVTCIFKQASKHRVQGPKLRLLGKKKFISVKVIIKLIVNQIFENSGNKRKHLNRSIIRSTVGLTTFENGGKVSNFPAFWKNTSFNQKMKYVTK